MATSRESIIQYVKAPAQMMKDFGVGTASGVVTGTIVGSMNRKAMREENRRERQEIREEEEALRKKDSKKSKDLINKYYDEARERQEEEQMNNSIVYPMGKNAGVKDFFKNFGAAREGIKDFLSNEGAKTIVEHTLPSSSNLETLDKSYRKTVEELGKSSVSHKIAETNLDHFYDNHLHLIDDTTPSPLDHFKANVYHNKKDLSEGINDDILDTPYAHLVRGQESKGFDTYKTYEAIQKHHSALEEAHQASIQKKLELENELIKHDLDRKAHAKNLEAIHKETASHLGLDFSSMSPAEQDLVRTHSPLEFHSRMRNFQQENVKSKAVRPLVDKAEIGAGLLGAGYAAKKVVDAVKWNRAAKEEMEDIVKRMESNKKLISLSDEQKKGLAIAGGVGASALGAGALYNSLSSSPKSPTSSPKSDYAEIPHPLQSFAPRPISSQKSPIKLPVVKDHDYTAKFASISSTTEMASDLFTTGKEAIHAASDATSTVYKKKAKQLSDALGLDPEKNPKLHSLLNTNKGHAITASALAALGGVVSHNAIKRLGGYKNVGRVVSPSSVEVLEKMKGTYKEPASVVPYVAGGAAAGAGGAYLLSSQYPKDKDASFSFAEAASLAANGAKSGAKAVKPAGSSLTRELLKAGLFMGIGASAVPAFELATADMRKKLFAARYPQLTNPLMMNSSPYYGGGMGSGWPLYQDPSSYQGY